jgi:hypothetical protein
MRGLNSAFLLYCHAEFFQGVFGEIVKSQKDPSALRDWGIIRHARERGHPQMEFFNKTATGFRPSPE